MKILKRIIFFLLFILFLIILLIRGYYKSHIKINDNYMLLDDKTGYALINSKTSVRLTSISKSIVWYCDTSSYILGCLGDDLSGKSESFEPQCQNIYFILNKRTSQNKEFILRSEFYFFIEENSLKCNKIDLY